MIAAIESVIGVYVPLNGEGIASLNLEWIAAGLFVLLFTWFLLKLSLRFFDWLCGKRV